MYDEDTKIKCLVFDPHKEKGQKITIGHIQYMIEKVRVIPPNKINSILFSK